MSIQSVFTYGTLQVPEVIEIVTGKQLTAVPATLAGYQRYKFKDKTYPGIIKNEACTIEGMLYENIDEQSLTALDEFEDIMYERRLLEVQVNHETKQAYVYVTMDEYKDWLSDTVWELELFKRKYLKFYLKRISNF